MRVLVVLIVLLLIPQAYAAIFVDSSTGEEVTQGVVRLEYDGMAQEFLLTDASLPSETTDGLLVLVGGGETYTYYARLPAGPVPAAIIMHPGGLLMGELQDSTNNLLVEKNVLVSCGAVEERLMSDATGRFRIFLPAGPCTVSASAGDYAGSEDVIITQGEVTSLDLIIDRGVAGNGSNLTWLLWIIPLLVILVVLLMWKPKRDWKGPKPKKLEKHFIAEQHREALKEKEELIVDELLLRGGTCRLSELRTATKVPRTSLLRCLEGLEQRGLLVKKEHNGKPVIELVKK
ncbi:hypothetical protein GOV07_02500 [Candidatus Woesearchaeota archaeon]|nr:hypothetical protein [Candidatus Woesearchaeota archaeon]